MEPNDPMVKTTLRAAKRFGVDEKKVEEALTAKESKKIVAVWGKAGRLRVALRQSGRANWEGHDFDFPGPFGSKDRLGVEWHVGECECEGWETILPPVYRYPLKDESLRELYETWKKNNQLISGG